MKKTFVVLFFLILTKALYSQGFCNVVYSGNILRFGDNTKFDVPIGLHFAYKQDNFIGFFTSFKASSGLDINKKYLKLDPFSKKPADTESGDDFDFLLFNFGINNYLLENLGYFVGLGLASKTYYTKYKTSQALGYEGEYLVPKDRTIKELNINLGVFYRLQNIVIVQLEYDYAVNGISLGFGFSLDKLPTFNFGSKIQSSEIYKPEEEKKEEVKDIENFDK